METGEILRSLMRASMIGNRELSRRTKVPLATINKLLDQPGIQSRDSTLGPIAKYFKVSLGQLRGYETIPGLTSQGDLQQRGVPILTADKIGAWIDDALDPKLVREWISTSFQHSKQAFGFLVTDNAIDDRFEREDVLIVDPLATGNENGICLIMRDSTAAFRYRGEDLGRVVYTTSNAAYKPLGEEDCVLVGYAVARPEQLFSATYSNEGDTPKPSIPRTIPKDLVDLDLMQECMKIVDEAMTEEPDIHSDRAKLVNHLYNYCVENSYTLEKLRGSPPDVKQLSVA